MTNAFIATNQSATAGNRIAESADGLTWASVGNATAFNNGSGANYEALCYAPAINVIVAILNGSVSGNPTNGPVMWSGDKGVTWNAAGASNMLGIHWNDVCWAASLGLFIACASGAGTSLIATSPDGATWTLRTITTGNWNAICWSPEKGLAVVVGDSNIIAHSTDGITWTAATGLPATSKNWTAICWAGDGLGAGQQKFCATTNSGGGANDFIYSSDGITWSQRNLSGSAFAWNQIKYSPALDMVGVDGGNTGLFCWSTNVTAGFTQISTGLGTNAFGAMCWSITAGKWFLCNSTNIYTSLNGTTWASNAGSSLDTDRMISLDPAPVNAGSAKSAGSYWLLGP